MPCPYLNTDNPHCSKYLNISHLNEAFELCTSSYMLCPVYLQLSENPREIADMAAVGAAQTD